MRFGVLLAATETNPVIGLHVRLDFAPAENHRAAQLVVRQNLSGHQLSTVRMVLLSCRATSFF